MSAAALPLSPRDARPGLGRLTLVELRKMTDTRAGFWLLASVVGFTLLLVAITIIVGEATDHRLKIMLEAAAAPSSVLLPIVGILLVTSEWTQRTAQIAFTLVPNRSRVVAAKIGASLVLAGAAFVVSVVVALAGTAIVAPSGDDGWSLSAAMLGQTALSLAISMLSGVALGALLLSSAPAIVAYFVLPLVVGTLGAIRVLQDFTVWIDATESLGVMTEHVLSGTEWAHAGTAFAALVLLPLLVGWRRITRGEAP